MAFQCNWKKKILNSDECELRGDDSISIFALSNNTASCKYDKVVPLFARSCAMRMAAGTAFLPSKYYNEEVLVSTPMHNANI